jgi:nucleotide-binding universal stress UspA family protein
MFSRILAPIAFSARCQGAVQYAEALASHFHSELVLLHVVNPVQASGFPDAMAVAPELTDEVKIQSRAALENFAAGALKGVCIKRVLLEGDPSRKIVEYAKEAECDLIVMPTHGYGPFRRFLLGSVTAKVLHDAHCAVWTGPHMEEASAYPSIGFRKVLCAVDLGPESRSVLEWGSRFAWEYGASLAAVHAIPASTVSLGGIYFDPQWHERVLQESERLISSMLAEVGATGEITITSGDAPLVVHSVAKEQGADVLVIGRGRTDGILGRLRTNAYAILRESPCPVAAI